MEKLVFDSVKKIWVGVTKSHSEKDLNIEIELHKKLLNFFQVGDFCYFILNIVDGNLEYLNSKVFDIYGYNSDDFTMENFLSYIHPDDLGYFINCENTVVDFFSQLPPDKIQKYKVRYDYRVRKADGNYIRILHQVLTIHSTDEGAIIRTLVSHTDISHLKKDNKSSLSFIGLDGEPSYIDVAILKTLKHRKEVVTNREKAIIYQLAMGQTSRQIGIELGISKNTVDTHRKNILKKTDCKSVAELIAKAIEKGWM
ncbi:LuxR C-terminal-related transcriptional regulator [Flavobacterium sp. N1994]|uniref:LuxR C-terminal-related transcriptional regulator n=1 Tax=Flavobacterium sp. N1994 TaxID=2986827 RepID=UPI0022224247|nr:LuxR C-terminal-related transcriptional regulator [Flavobacterium sp. N1994]